MSFADLLNKPLPSKTYTESVDEQPGSGSVVDPVSDEPETYGSVQESDDSESELDASELDELEDDLDDIDLSDLSDEELAKLEEDISYSDIDDAVGDEPEVSLSPEEEREADDMMGVAATTELIKSELSAEDQQKFYESVDAKIAVFENLLMESDLYRALLLQLMYPLRLTMIRCILSIRRFLESEELQELSFVRSIVVKQSVV